jgi:chloramphenicol-sensitive protein RarD
VGAYGLWGVLPPFFLLLHPSDPLEVVAFRILMSLLFCALLLTALRAWRRTLALARQPRILLLMLAAAVLIYVNWQVFVLAVLTGHVVEGSLGYFINPIVTVLLGVIALRERLRPARWVALGIATVAILVIAIGYGEFPWIALALAFSFGLYGLVKKVVGPRVDALSGLTLETAWLAPVGIALLGVVTLTAGIEFGRGDATHTVAMLLTGVVTTVPLLFFAAGARRLPLVVLGMTQYLAPTIQFLFGVLIMREDMPTQRWMGFALVWVALAVLTVDMVVANRPQRRASLERP